jgi:hypothetical protein
MWQWKRDYTIKPPNQQATIKESTYMPMPHNLVPDVVSFDDPFVSGFFTNWDNWPQLGPTELSNLFTYDFDVGIGNI